MECPTCKGTGEVKDTSFDFERLYAMYPHRLNQNKKAGMRRLNGSIKSLEDYARLESAIQKYARYVKVSRTDEKFIKSFGTFCSGWEEWVEPVPAFKQVSAPMPTLKMIPEPHDEDPRQRTPEEIKKLLDSALNIRNRT